jgi:hypothetical protein
VQIDSVFAGGALEHSDIWLTAVAPVGRRMRAVVYAVKARPGGFELLGHEFVD